MLAVTDDHGAYIYDLSVEGGRYGGSDGRSTPAIVCSLRKRAV
jgi:hypothetical protein